MAQRGRPKKQLSTAIVAGISKEVQTIVPVESFTALNWWNKLDEQEQQTVQVEGQKLATALMNYGYSRLSVGEHLSKLRSILEPHNLFGKFLRNFHFSKRTAYRYIAGFENAKSRLPEPIIKAAMARGINIIGDTETRPLGVYTEAVASLPPPTNPSEEQANTWLEQVENVRKQNRSTGPSSTFTLPVIPQNPETLLKECYRFVSSRYRKLPSNHKTRASFIHRLTGMLMTELGISNAQSFTPMAIPEGYKAERGRPKLAATA